MLSIVCYLGEEAKVEQAWFFNFKFGLGSGSRDYNFQYEACKLFWTQFINFLKFEIQKFSLIT